jgi:guanylate kinase
MKKANYEQPLCSLPTKALLIVLSGPSGAGKDALLARMKESDYPLEYITTVTTRARRAGERDNVDYHFISTEKFQGMVENNELLEWANVYGNWYGVPRQPVKQALEQGKDTIVKVDTQGAATIKKILPEATFILVVPPSKEELVTRLKERQTESPPDLSLRMKAVEEEIKQLPLFDYIIVNRHDKIDLAISDIKAIIAAEKCRVRARKITL